MYQARDKSQKLQARLDTFMDEHVYANEETPKRQLGAATKRFAPLPIVEELKAKAQEAGLWNLFLPEEHAQYCDHGGLGFTDYAPLAETMGRVLWAAEVFNCSAPDTGNMEGFMNFASSDATNIELSIRRDADQWVLDGRKWFITGAMNERTRIFIVMATTDPDNPDRHRQQTQVLVTRDTPGIQLVRSLTTLGYDDAPVGHAEMVFDQVRVPLENVLLGEGRGFEIAQGRLGPERMHHCMRLIGCAQRALVLACHRVTQRSTFGRRLSQHQSVREDIARIFSEVQMGRLLILQTCSKIDEQALSSYLENVVDGFSGPLSATKFADGQSNPTYRIDASSGEYAAPLAAMAVELLAS